MVRCYLCAGCPSLTEKWWCRCLNDSQRVNGGCCSSFLP